MEAKVNTLGAMIESLEQRQSEVGDQAVEAMQSKDYLKNKLASSSQDISGKGVSQGSYNSTKAILSKKDVQRALKNAGFYAGPIDGEIGKKTKNAIQEFQKAKGLKPDGFIGTKTKSLLSQYL